MGLAAESESTFACFAVMKKYFIKYGDPCAFYIEKNGVFRVKKSDANSGTGLTQFGRACLTLGISNLDTILAKHYSKSLSKNLTTQHNIIYHTSLHISGNWRSRHIRLLEYLDGSIKMYYLNKEIKYKTVFRKDPVEKIVQM